MPTNYWLVKSEPDCYSIDDLQRDGETYWSGVRNYQARNYMRDGMKPGDGVLYYHSSTEPMGIVGTATVSREAYPDHTALDPDDDHYDPRHTPDTPVWMMVDVQFTQKFEKPITLEELRANPKLAEMVVLKRGNRLSVTPVTPDEWKAVLAMRR